MKLVIDTQHTENYGAHDWDGQGECPQHWKNKGGAVYVVEGITMDQRDLILRKGIPNLTDLIESSDEYSTESIVGHMIVDNLSEPWCDYDHPWFLKYTDSKWTATRYRQSTIETYTMTANGGRENLSIKGDDK